MPFDARVGHFLVRIDGTFNNGYYISVVISPLTLSFFGTLQKDDFHRLMG